MTLQIVVEIIVVEIIKYKLSLTFCRDDRNRSRNDGRSRISGVNYRGRWQGTRGEQYTNDVGSIVHVHRISACGGLFSGNESDFDTFVLPIVKDNLGVVLHAVGHLAESCLPTSETAPNTARNDKERANQTVAPLLPLFVRGGLHFNCFVELLELRCVLAACHKLLELGGHGIHFAHAFELRTYGIPELLTGRDQIGTDVDTVVRRRRGLFDLLK